MECLGTIQNRQLTLPAIQQELRQQYLSTMKEEQLIRIKYTKVAAQKTHQQVKTHFGLVIEMVRRKLEEMGVDICGVACNKQMVYDILIKACGGVGDMGETLTLSQMTIEQASKFFKNCRTWTATQLQLVIPDPDKNWRNKRSGQND